MTSVSDALYGTNDVQLERFGPGEAQYEAFCGPQLGCFEPFCHPRVPVGAHHGPKTMIWRYLGLRGSNRNSTGILGCNPPLLMVCTP